MIELCAIRVVSWTVNRAVSAVASSFFHSIQIELTYSDIDDSYVQLKGREGIVQLTASRNNAALIPFNLRGVRLKAGSHTDGV